MSNLGAHKQIFQSLRTFMRKIYYTSKKIQKLFGLKNSPPIYMSIFSYFVRVF